VILCLDAAFFASAVIVVFTRRGPIVRPSSSTKMSPEGRNVGAQSEPAASWSAFWRVRWSSRACSTGVVSRIVRRVLPVFTSR